MRLFWRLDQPTDENYMAFVHLLDAGGALVAPDDSEPSAGRYPTSLWPAGEGVEDVHLLKLPPDLAPGRYTVLAGAYGRGDGHRLTLTDGGTALLIGSITIPE